MLQNIIDFLTFKTLISPYVLIICYYIGALIIPVASYSLISLAKKWFKSRYPDNLVATKLSQQIPQQFIKRFLSYFFSIENKYLWYSLFFVLFLSMEIMWRMMFEFLIAYFQIRDALIS